MKKAKFRAGQVVAFTDFAPARPLRIKKVILDGLGFYYRFYDAPDLKHEVAEESLRHMTLNEVMRNRA